eukprot:TRINITY_DN16449_c0_g1_i1.p1 TRINITY_DN16449_c0_g1~~TRINITY_DN16449_c0_g1_i1.p1  ORF type:complete len:186 (+),score=32.59 TRINITY_DN16449_c0_g1_i1:79-636(+)
MGCEGSKDQPSGDPFMDGPPVPTMQPLSSVDDEALAGLCRRIVARGDGEHTPMKQMALQFLGQRSGAKPGKRTPGQRRLIRMVSKWDLELAAQAVASWCMGVRRRRFALSVLRKVMVRLCSRAPMIAFAGWGREMRRDKAERKSFGEQQETIFKATQGQIRLDQVSLLPCRTQCSRRVAASDSAP